MMEHKYIVMEEFVRVCDDDYYSDYTEDYPVYICETHEHAEDLIEDLEQGFADKYMDWLDENKQYLKLGCMSIDKYYDKDRPDRYYIEEVPYIKK